MAKNCIKKVALVGNMNNNNFSIMRYFRDLGVDAHLILNRNDGLGDSSHFIPIADTWNFSKWEPFIHESNLNEDPISAFKMPFAFLFSLRSLIRKIFNNKIPLLLPVSNRGITKSLSGYTDIIGSGITPAIFQRIKKKITIYYPYAIGVEWYSDPVFVKKTESKRLLNGIIGRLLIRKQKTGIKNSKYVICSDKSLTLKALKEIGVNPISAFCPMVYNNEILPNIIMNNEILAVFELIEKSDFSILSHARQKWFRPENIDNEEWNGQNKNNDWLINSFSDLINTKTVRNPILILFEYGDDVEQSKKLCNKLNVTEFVFWMKKISRKEILLILSKIDVGVGEFYNLPFMLFGGTGYEILASGIPLIQGYNFPGNSFMEIYDIPIPPLLPVTKKQDVFNHLLNLANDVLKRKAIGIESKKWFDTYCGIGLAKKWLELLN